MNRTFLLRVFRPFSGTAFCRHLIQQFDRTLMIHISVLINTGRLHCIYVPAATVVVNSDDLRQGQFDKQRDERNGRVTGVLLLTKPIKRRQS